MLERLRGRPEHRNRQGSRPLVRAPGDGSSRRALRPHTPHQRLVLWLVALSAVSVSSEANSEPRVWWQLAGQHDADLTGQHAHSHSVLRRLRPATTMER